MGISKSKMKLFSYFALLAGALAYDQVIIDENGMYAYVDSGERSSSPQFGPPQKGPRECNGVKVPNYKHGKYYCKPVKKNRSKGKKKSASSSATRASRSNGRTRARTPKSQRTAASSASPARDGSPSQRPFPASANKSTNKRPQNVLKKK